MILKKLYLHDYGVFSGKHEIDLTPRVKYGRKRPIILFGGLNGAGKTTTLTAVRLALYGRQSLGRSISVQTYHQQLADFIHKPSKKTIAPYSSSVGLSFTYGKHGKLSEYQIKRSWEVKGKKVIEHLDILEDDKPLKGLNSEQLQSFLNELIPIGVADLFFFDGEKIADLAEDNTNEALSDAINRLLGLDIIQRLRADLGIYLRENTQTKLPKDITKEIRSLEKEYNSNYSEYEKHLGEIQQLSTQLVSTSSDITAVKQRINDLGGAWAKSREAEELRSGQLLSEKKSINSDLISLLSDSIPLALAPNSLSELLGTLKAEQKIKEQLSARKQLSKHLDKLRKQLNKDLGQKNKSTIESAIDHAFSNILGTKQDTTIIHDVSDSSLEAINALISSYVPQQVSQLQRLGSRLETIEDEINTVSANIARAPEQSRLDNILSELEELQVKKGNIEKAIEVAREAAKKSLRTAMDNLRRLRDLDEKFSKSVSHGRGVELASNTREMLLEFGEQTKQRKIETLEQEFIKSFSKLARKDDMDIQAHINPQDFSVNLTDKHGKVINKKKLSAGEKQIYAIAMLEALGRTSGRNLPIIIDTPLGRLDSKHRTKLVNNYFPTASHQVLILSTDTEIDEEFYADLSPEISHAFSVDYDSTEGCSQYNEGYFWRN
ncbi:MAG: DNA sulfur modification protein DndD [Cellvibrionaceae bacterium]